MNNPTHDELLQEIERLQSLLLESKREHEHCEDSWFCCGKCDALDHDGEFPSSHRNRESGVCNCSADAWNACVDAALGAACGSLAGRTPTGEG